MLHSRIVMTTPVGGEDKENLALSQVFFFTILVRIELVKELMCVIVRLLFLARMDRGVTRAR